MTISLAPTANRDGTGSDSDDFDPQSQVAYRVWSADADIAKSIAVKKGRRSFISNVTACINTVLGPTKAQQLNKRKVNCGKKTTRNTTKATVAVTVACNNETPAIWDMPRMRSDTKHANDHERATNKGSGSSKCPTSPGTSIRSPCHSPDIKKMCISSDGKLIAMEVSKGMGEVTKFCKDDSNISSSDSYSLGSQDSLTMRSESDSALNNTYSTDTAASDNVDKGEQQRNPKPSCSKTDPAMEYPASQFNLAEKLYAPDYVDTSSSGGEGNERTTTVCSHRSKGLANNNVQTPEHEPVIFSQTFNRLN